MRYFIANWKANKNLSEAMDWVEQISRQPPWTDQFQIVVCPPHSLIYPLKEKLGNLKNVSLGAQNISDLESGSFTGEVTAKSLQGIADYVILGHSERRRLFNETNESLAKKIRLAKKYRIEPILCVRNNEDLTSETVKFITYEPVHSIGTGENEALEEILKTKKSLNLSMDTSFFYGGSVSANNIKDYLSADGINGFLVGTASLNPLDFYRLFG